MKKSVILTAIGAALFAVVSYAPARAQANEYSDLSYHISVNHLQSVLGEISPFDLINWKVGDTANYQISIGQFGKVGTMVEAVTMDTGPALWVKETMALQGQNNVTEILINKADGKILKMKVNGQEQAVPDEKPEVTNQEYTSVTVPAGTFKCLHITANTSQVKGMQLWANPQATVMEGNLKTLMPVQGLMVDIELMSYMHGAL